MKKTRIKIITIFLIASIIFAGILSRSFVENTIEYEVVSTENNKTEEINTDISETSPSEDGYIVYLDNDTLYVYMPNGEAVYKENNITNSNFTENDLIKLRKSGIAVSGFTELIELLNYIKS